MPTKLTVNKKIKKASESEEIFIGWSKLITGACVYLIYAILLAYAGIFYIWLLLAGFFVIAYWSGALSGTVFLFRTFFLERFDFLRFLMVIAWVVWFVLLLFYSPFPAFSGRDEGSYANAALYLARFHDVEFQLPLASFLNGEGPAHQSLNFPGFVIVGDKLASQFSPAYFVLQSIFYTFTGTETIFSLVNGFLILGGSIAFYLLIRLFAPRWFAVSGMLALMFNFVFLWFPRFTFSENLAFCLFFNLLYLLFLFRKSKNMAFAYPIAALVVLFPLVRPEGWWVSAATLMVLGMWYRKGVIKNVGENLIMKVSLVFVLGIAFTTYAAYHLLPVYKRLLRDWLEWPSTESNYANVADGSFTLSDIGRIILAPFPSLERFLYYLRVEWNYGVLVFGIIALAALLIFLFDKKRRIFTSKMRNLIGTAAFLSFPFFTAFVSPQVSMDHPWMLRRFFFVVLPCGILAALVLILTLMDKMPRLSSGKQGKLPVPLVSFLLALMLVPSLSASAYFLAVRTDEGREEVLRKLGNYFNDNDYIFINREASGDGWRMWAEPLSSLYGKNAAYIYSPDNLIDNRRLLIDRYKSGKKNYVILPENTFNFEHELGKHFDLFLDREVSFRNIQFTAGAGTYNSRFPTLENREFKVRVYSLVPK